VDYVLGLVFLFFALLAWPMGMPTQRMKHENKKRHEQATTGSRKVTLGT